MRDQKELEKTLTYIMNRSSVDEFKKLLIAYENRIKKSASKKHLDLSKISSNKDLLRAVNFILHRSENEELDFISEAINRRIGDKKVVNKNNKFDKLAGGLISRINRQLDVSKTTIERTARLLVADMILQHDPDIPQEHLEVLLDEWIPASDKKKKKMNLPKDVAVTMISQFLSYSTGKMPLNDTGDFPKGWVEKYWNSFTIDVQKLISEYLHNKINEAAFWKGIDELV